MCIAAHLLMVHAKDSETCRHMLHAHSLGTKAAKTALGQLRGFHQPELGVQLCMIKHLPGDHAYMHTQHGASN